MNDSEKRDTLMELFIVVMRIKASLKDGDVEKAQKCIDTELEIIKGRLSGFNMADALTKIEKALCNQGSYSQSDI